MFPLPNISIILAMVNLIAGLILLTSSNVEWWPICLAEYKFTLSVFITTAMSLGSA